MDEEKDLKGGLERPQSAGLNKSISVVVFQSRPQDKTAFTQRRVHVEADEERRGCEGHVLQCDGAECSAVLAHRGGGSGMPPT